MFNQQWLCFGSRHWGHHLVMDDLRYLRLFDHTRASCLWKQTYLPEKKKTKKMIKETKKQSRQPYLLEKLVLWRTKPVATHCFCLQEWLLWCSSLQLLVSRQIVRRFFSAYQTKLLRYSKVKYKYTIKHKNVEAVRTLAGLKKVRPKP